MSKKRVGIYVDTVLWESVRAEARKGSVLLEKDISASKFVEDALRAFLSVLPNSKLAQPKKFEFHKPKAKKPVMSSIGVLAGEMQETQVDESEKTEAQTIAEGQAKLDAVRKARGTVKSETIGRVRATVEGMMGHSGPLTKASQVGKKVKN